MAVGPVSGSSTPTTKAAAEPEVKETEKSKKPEVAASAEAATASPEAPAPSSKDTQKSEKKLQEQTKSASLFSQLSDGASSLVDSASKFIADAQKPIKPGDSGPKVKAYQEKVNEWRVDQGKKPITADGSYGDKTEAAVKEFQKASGLKSDGVLGPETRDRLVLETNKDFKELSTETKETARKLMKDLGGKPEARAQLISVATDPDLKAIPQEKHSDALIWASEATSADEIEMLRDYTSKSAKMEKDPNFQALNDDTKTQLRNLADMSAGYPEASSGVLDFATDPNFGKLNREHQQATLDAYKASGGSGEFAKDIREMVGSQDFQKLEDGLKTRILTMAKEAPSPAFAADAKAIVSNPVFGKMSLKEKEMTVNVMENATPSGRTSLLKTMNRDIYGTSALMTKGYGETGTLLDQLDKLAKTPLDARLLDQAGAPIDKKQVVSDLLDEVADPYQFINQDNRGTCTVTSMTHKLALMKPAEYARLVTDLATTGKSKLANGVDIAVPSADVYQSDGSARSDGERLVQATLMAYARPGKGYQNWAPGPDGVRGTVDDGQSDPTNPTSVSLDGFSDRPGSGLQPPEMERVLEGIHGQDFVTYTGEKKTKDPQGDMITKTEKLLKDGKGPVVISMQWGTAGHAVEVTDVRDGKVFYRNPWGGNNLATGSVFGTQANNTGGGPLRTIENGSAAIESMALADFKAAVNGIYAPVY